MKFTGRAGVFAALISWLVMGVASAQSTQPSQNQQVQSQNQGDAYTGVSHPPPNSTIVATEDLPSAEQNPAPAAKPSPAIPASQPAPAATAKAATPAAAKKPTNPDYSIVTTFPSANAGGTDHSDAENPEYGIVTTPPPAEPTLKPGEWNPASHIVNYVPINPDALAEGTNIAVRLSQRLSTAATTRGTAFTAVVSQNVYNGSNLVIPAGAEMRGVVVHVSQGHHLINRAALMLRPDEIVLPDGTVYHLYATAVESEAPFTKVNDEGGIVASHHYGKDAVEYGAGAGIGAAAGGALGGPVGAGVGSVVGAGLVSTHMLTQPTEAAVLPQGSVLIFSLTEPMRLTPTKD